MHLLTDVKQSNGVLEKSEKVNFTFFFFASRPALYDFFGIMVERVNAKTILEGKKTAIIFKP